jgi:hypothetical protein
MKKPQEIQIKDLPIKLRPMAEELGEIEPLIELFRCGKLYEVEQWIAGGKSIQ